MPRHSSNSREPTTRLRFSLRRFLLWIAVLSAYLALVGDAWRRLLEFDRRSTPAGITLLVELLALVWATEVLAALVILKTLGTQRPPT
jgi:hypothetical protein